MYLYDIYSKLAYRLCIVLLAGVFALSIVGGCSRAKGPSSDARPRTLIIGQPMQPPQGINLDEILGQAQRVQPRDARYEITITKEQAAKGMEKDLTRRGKTLRVKIPPGVKSGTTVRLRNARRITDGQAGDILVLVKVK